MRRIRIPISNQRPSQEGNELSINSNAYRALTLVSTQLALFLIGIPKENEFVRDQRKIIEKNRAEYLQRVKELEIERLQKIKFAEVEKDPEK